MKLVDKAAKILNCEGCNETVLNARLIKVGLGKVCDRCGGTGRYSYNQKDGTVCYGCKGTGWKAQKVTKALMIELEKKEESGEIAQYLTDLEKRIAEKKWTKEHGFKYLCKKHEETEITQYFNWWDVSETMPELAAINKMFSEVVKKASESETNLIKAKKGRITYNWNDHKQTIKQCNIDFNNAVSLWEEYKEKYQPEKIK